jgi:predicted Fe-Mo cluster-binding NifX family protein
MGDTICTTVGEDFTFDLFSRAKYIVLIKDGAVVHREVNPALSSTNKRPTVAKRCVELGATVVLAPHGSLCLPSYLILRRAGVRMYVVKPGVAFNNDVRASPVNSWEVIYSSLLAVAERVGEVFSHGHG